MKTPKKWDWSEVARRLPSKASDERSLVMKRRKSRIIDRRLSVCCGRLPLTLSCPGQSVEVHLMHRGAPIWRYHAPAQLRMLRMRLQRRTLLNGPMVHVHILCYLRFITPLNGPAPYVVSASSLTRHSMAQSACRSQHDTHTDGERPQI